MSKELSAILPASGLATRMRGLPKFLLPCDEEYVSLLERHVEELLKVCDTIWIPVRPDLSHLVESLGLASERVVIVSMNTSSMTETVRRVVELSSSPKFLIVMPDTYFFGELPYSALAKSTSDLHLACWRIREEQFGKLGQVDLVDSKHGGVDKLVVSSRDKDPNCRFIHSWGAMSFKRNVFKLALDSMPHTGYLIEPALQNGLNVSADVMDGLYFDCGTPSEYLSMLKHSSNAGSAGTEALR